MEKIGDGEETDVRTVVVNKIEMPNAVRIEYVPLVTAMAVMMEKEVATDAIVPKDYDGDDKGDKKAEERGYHNNGMYKDGKDARNGDSNVTDRVAMMNMVKLTS